MNDESTKRKRTDAELVAALDKLDAAILDPDYPIELVEEELRAVGLDPDKVARDGVSLVEHLKAQRGTK